MSNCSLNYFKQFFSTINKIFTTETRKNEPILIVFNKVSDFLIPAEPLRLYILFFVINCTKSFSVNVTRLWNSALNMMNVHFYKHSIS